MFIPTTHSHITEIYNLIGLENEYFLFLKNATCNFTAQQKNVIVQIYAVHVKSDITYKGGKIIAPSLDTQDPIRQF